MASSASESLGISTNPNPFDCPDILSMITFALETSPKSANAARKSSSVTLYGKLPTYIFMILPLELIPETLIQKVGAGSILVQNSLWC
jgi:hypothetical protein